MLIENVFVSAVFGALSALEALCDYALYKSTFYLLTYLLTALAWRRADKKRFIASGVGTMGTGGYNIVPPSSGLVPPVPPKSKMPLMSKF